MTAWTLGGAILAIIWSVGSWRLWRLQNKSTNVAGVRAADRAIALLWMPIMLGCVFASAPALIRHRMAQGARRKLPPAPQSPAARCSRYPHLVRLDRQGGEAGGQGCTDHPVLMDAPKAET
jgi:hypothetical protein